MSVTKRSARISALKGRDKSTPEQRELIAEKLRKEIDERSRQVHAA